MARHSALTSLLIDKGELEQGLADAYDYEWGVSQQGQSTVHLFESASKLIGRGLHYSCMELGLLDGGRKLPGMTINRIIGALKQSTRYRLEKVTVKPLEGFAYYSLYPEMYMRATEQFLAESKAKDVRIIGILSMGAPLAIAVEATIRANKRLVTVYAVRPTGHPYTRQLNIAEDSSVKAFSNGIYSGRVVAWQAGKLQFLHLIVDEGPGLSGSSFGAVADWLEAQGLARERIVFFPSHDNPLGPQASEAHRERWASATKYVASFESVFIETGRLAEWVSDLTGGAGELEDIGYGRWRAKLLPQQDDWPPVNIQQERRKYLCNAGGRQWLLKFVGLGHYGDDKLPLARSLAEAGFITPLVGLRHGFSVSEWLAEAKPLTNALLRQIDRTRLVDFVAAYLAHRARHFPAPAGAGATVPQLYEMMRYNTAQSIGEAYTARLEGWQAQLDELAAHERRVLTDNKMQPWEWLLLPDGRLLKADALDHHASHDLVGAQDIAWDIVGAIIELNLSRDEVQRLLAAFAAEAGYRPSNQQLAFYTYAYLAFQVGHYTLSAQALAGEAEEATRLRERADAWARLLGERIDLPPLYELE